MQKMYSCQPRDKSLIIHNVDMMAASPLFEFLTHWKIEPYVLSSLDLGSITHVEEFNIKLGEAVKIEKDTLFIPGRCELKETGEVMLYQHHMLNGNWLYATKDLLKEHTELQGEQ